MPVIAHAGTRIERVAGIVATAGGAIAVTGLKVDGVSLNHVDPARWQRFMDADRGAGEIGLRKLSDVTLHAASAHWRRRRVIQERQSRRFT